MIEFQKFETFSLPPSCHHFFHFGSPEKKNKFKSFSPRAILILLWKRPNNNLYKSYLAPCSRRWNIFFFWFPSFVFENHSCCSKCHFAWLLSGSFSSLFLYIFKNRQLYLSTATRQSFSLVLWVFFLSFLTIKTVKTNMYIKCYHGGGSENECTRNILFVVVCRYFVSFMVFYLHCRYSVRFNWVFVWKN